MWQYNVVVKSEKKRFTILLRSFVTTVEISTQDQQWKIDGLAKLRGDKINFF